MPDVQGFLYFADPALLLHRREHTLCSITHYFVLYTFHITSNGPLKLPNILRFAPGTEAPLKATHTAFPAGGVHPVVARRDRPFSVPINVELVAQGVAGGTLLHGLETRRRTNLTL